MDLEGFYRKSAARFEGALFRFYPEFVTRKTELMIFTCKIASGLMVWISAVPFFHSAVEKNVQQEKLLLIVRKPLHGLKLKRHTFK